MELIEVVLHGETLSTVASQAKNLHETRQFGERSGERIVYMPEEVYFLLQEKKVSLLNSSYKPLQTQTFIRKMTRMNKRFLSRCAVYADLRTKGYIVKPALKYGGDFRIYGKGKKIGSSHALWICFVVSEHEKVSSQEFVAKNRVAHSTKKQLLLAMVDSEQSVSYFEIQWKKIA